MSDIVEEVRASALPVAFICPGAVRTPTLQIREESAGAAAVGSAVHEALRSLVEDGAVRWHEVPAIAARHNASVDEVRMLCGMASKLWPIVAPHFAGAITEVELAGHLTFMGADVTLTGHADLLAVHATAARVGDWKTGRKDHDYAEQMRGYAALALLEDGALTEATATVLWVRDGEIENYTMHRSSLKHWLAELVERVIEWDGVYHPGRQCGFCPRSHDCPAFDAMIRRDVSALLAPDDPATTLVNMPPEQIVELLGKADMVKRAAERVRAAIKAHVEARGELVAGGVRLAIETHNEREVDPAKAWPVLEAAGFVDVDFASCIDLSITRAEKRVATKAGRGKGAGAVRELAAKLTEAGAVKLVEKRTLKERRT